MLNQNKSERVMFILNDELEDCEYDSSDVRDKSPASDSFVSFC